MLTQMFLRRVGVDTQLLKQNNKTLATYLRRIHNASRLALIDWAITK